MCKQFFRKKHLEKRIRLLKRATIFLTIVLVALLVFILIYHLIKNFVNTLIAAGMYKLITINRN